MAFERFDGSRRSYTPRVSITKKGMFLLNRACTEKYVADKEHVMLYFDREERRVGMEFCQDNRAGSLNIRRRVSGSNVSAKVFCDYFGIDYQQTKRYDVSILNGMLIFEVE